jgi:hypothetical protein
MSRIQFGLNIKCNDESSLLYAELNEHSKFILFFRKIF